jgi:hypothetical protein
MKSFLIPKEKIIRLIPHNGGCISTDEITIAGKDIGYMYREETNRLHDTGWRFFAGDESDDYLNDTSKSSVYMLNTIANYDPAILDYLNEPAPCYFKRIKASNMFRKINHK